MIVAGLILILVINVFDFYWSFNPFFVATIVCVDMKFIFVWFSFILRSADLAAQLLCISRGLFDIFAALCFKVEPLARQVSRNVS